MLQAASIHTTTATSSEPLTMSSLDIADLTGKQHKNVLVDIRNTLRELGFHSAEFSAEYRDSTGRALPCFHLPKRECLILISGYSVKLRARIIDRWMELEAAEHQRAMQAAIKNAADLGYQTKVQAEEDARIVYFAIAKDCNHCVSLPALVRRVRNRIPSARVWDAVRRLEGRGVVQVNRPASYPGAHQTVTVVASRVRTERPAIVNDDAGALTLRSLYALVMNANLRVDKGEAHDFGDALEQTLEDHRVRQLGGAPSGKLLIALE